MKNQGFLGFPRHLYEVPTTSSRMPQHPPGMREEVVGDSLWISFDFQWIWVDVLHMDSHLYLYYLQNISRRQILTEPVSFHFVSDVEPFLFTKLIMFVKAYHF